MAKEPELQVALNAYHAVATQQARNYDKTQDISPQQMHILLEACERTGANLGQMLATGEQESAKTWNNYVRPPVGRGLGAAVGVWQFEPSTFASTLRMYGDDILRASSADPSKNRPALDLGNEHFTDAQARDLIQKMVDHKIAGDAPEVQALRSSFAVLALAKHSLNVDSGAKDPSAENLSHFLGAGTAETILKLAHNPASRSTPIVTMAGGAPGVFEASNYTVTGNPGMFYRDGAGKTQPFTVEEFVRHADVFYGAGNSDAHVRNKYGVGFSLKGGDEAGWNVKTLGLKQLKSSLPKSGEANFTAPNGQPLVLAPQLAYGTLTHDETAQYKARLKTLIEKGEDKPTDTLPPAETQQVVEALKRQHVLPKDAQVKALSDPQAQEALKLFRDKIGMSVPDDPAHDGKLTPALRVALEVYDHRLEHFADVQLRQQTEPSAGLDLRSYKYLTPEARKELEPQVIALKTALHEAGQLDQPSHKVGRRRQPLPFDGQIDAKTLAKMIAGVDTLQLRHGLQMTHGMVDGVTMEALKLPPQSNIHMPDWSKVYPETSSPASVFNQQGAVPDAPQEMVHLPAFPQLAMPRPEHVALPPAKHTPQHTHHHRHNHR